MKTIDGVPGFSIGGVHSGEFGIYLAKKYVDLLPETRDYEYTIFGKDGVEDYGTQFDKRKIPLVLKMQGESRQDLLDSLDRFATLLDPYKGYQQLIFDDEPLKCRWVKYSSGISSSTIDYIINQGAFTLGLKSKYPFKQGILPISVTHPFVAGQAFEVLNQGSRSVPMLITITTGVTLPSGLTLSFDGVSVQYKGEIATSDTITIDTKEMDVKKNGQNAIRYWDIDFPYLQPGINNVIETDAGSLGANITITFTEEWY